MIKISEYLTLGNRLVQLTVCLLPKVVLNQIYVALEQPKFENLAASQLPNYYKTIRLGQFQLNLNWNDKQQIDVSARLGYQTNDDHAFPSLFIPIAVEGGPTNFLHTWLLVSFRMQQLKMENKHISQDKSSVYLFQDPGISFSFHLFYLLFQAHLCSCCKLIYLNHPSSLFAIS